MLMEDEMNLHEEIAKTAFDLYEKSGCIKGRDCENWLEAERIVLARHASQDIEEPDEMSSEESMESLSVPGGEGMRETGAEMPLKTGGRSEEAEESVGTEELELRPLASAAEEIVVRTKTKGRPEKSVARVSKGSTAGRKKRTAPGKAK